MGQPTESQSLPEKATASPSAPWYESNLLWGPVSIVATIVLTIIAAVKHDFRWLLILAWPVSGVAIWWAAKRTREVWPITILGIMMSGGGLLWLNSWLRPATISTPPAVALSPVPKPPTQVLPPATGATEPTVPKPQVRKPQHHQGTASATPPTPPRVNASQGQTPPAINIAPGGFAVSGGILNSPTVNNYGPPARHLTDQQTKALADPSIKEFCNLPLFAVDVEWERTEEATNLGHEFVSALGKSVGFRSGREEGDTETPNKGLFLASDDWEHPNKCLLKIKNIFDSTGVAYQIGVMPKRDNRPQVVYFGNKRVEVPPPPIPPKTVIMIGIIG
jgi:hypothetical protein